MLDREYHEWHSKLCMHTFDQLWYGLWNFLDDLI
jgi:hypothetical protein